MDDIQAYKAMLSSDGNTERQRTVTRANRDFNTLAVNNPAYEATAKRNGVVQPFLFTRCDVKYKANIVAMPNDDLNVGDVIEVFGEHWIVVQMFGINTLQRSGLAWQCNYLLKFQNFSSDVIEKWVVLDSGIYSTTKKDDNTVSWLDVQFKAYLPYDDDTKKLFVDKRIAIDKIYNKDGNQILDVHCITRFDAESESYGTDGQLLILYLRSDSYNPDTDSLAEMICDYIAPPDAGGSTPNDELLNCEIVGRSTIKPTNVARSYTGNFYADDGTVDSTVTPVWTYTIPNGYENYITASVTSGTLTVRVNDVRAVGQIVSIELADDNGAYNTSTLSLEVVGV